MNEWFGPIGALLLLVGSVILLSTKKVGGRVIGGILFIAGVVLVGLGIGTAGL